MDDKQCEDNHSEIMRELNEIKSRMNADWQYIEASKDDLLFRTRLWNIVKWVGFGASTGLVIKVFEQLFTR
jgi:hypothetical protein